MLGFLQNLFKSQSTFDGCNRIPDTGQFIEEISLFGSLFGRLEVQEDGVGIGEASSHDTKQGSQ